MAGKQAYIGGASGPYAPPAASLLNLAVTAFSDEVVSGLLAGEADDWFIPYSYTPPATGLITVVNYPIAGTEMQEWKGTPAREELGSKARSYALSIKQMGAHTDMFRLRTGDTSHWSQAPDALFKAAGKKLGIDLGALWTAIMASPSSYLNVWGEPWLQATPGANLNNIFKPDLGGYYNYTVSQAFTEANILAAAIRLEQRRGTDGRKLGLKAQYLVVPWSLKRRAENFVKKLLLVPQVGPGGDDTGGNTSTISQEFEVLASIEMPDNLWGVWPDFGGFSAKMRPFTVLRGVGAPLKKLEVGSSTFGNASSVISGLEGGGGVVNLDAFANTGLPEHLVEFWGTNSAIYEMTHKVAVDVFTINGIDIQEGRLIEMCRVDA